MKFFNVDNPVWRFVGNLADFFVLSVLWAVCCLPVVTIGASTTALYYVTMKMARNREGELIPSFFASFRQNLRPGIALWVGYLAAGVLIGLNLLISVQNGSLVSGAMFITCAVLAILWALTETMQFPLLARCDNTVPALFKMGAAIAVRNIPAVAAAFITKAAFAAVGVFLFWPLLLLAPGLCAYCNAFLFNRILSKYGFDLLE